MSILSSLLHRVAERNDSLLLRRPSAAAAPHHKASAFHGLTKPSISIKSYLERIFRFANCSPACYVVAYIYLDRFLQRHPSVAVDSFNVHHFLITSVLAAVKFMDDVSMKRRLKTSEKRFSTNEELESSQMTTAIAIEDVRREVKILRALTGHSNLVQFDNFYYYCRLITVFLLLILLQKSFFFSLLYAHLLSYRCYDNQLIGYGFLFTGHYKFVCGCSNIRREAKKSKLNFLGHFLVFWCMIYCLL